MSEYKEIKGTNIEVVASDLSNPLDGQIWFNSTSNKIKLGKISTTGTYASASLLSTNRYQSAGAGTQTAALNAGGDSGPPAKRNETEEYDGSSWTAGGNIGTARNYQRGCGTQTAALIVGGDGPGPVVSPTKQDAVEEYDGSSWTNGGSYPAVMRGIGVTGTQTAGLAVGGNPWNANTYEYNGSSWTAGGNYPSPADRLMAGGTQTAGLGWGGFSPSLPGILNTSNEYNGSSWTAGGTLPSGKVWSTSSGTQTAAVGAGGFPGPSGSIETFVYNGSTWSQDTNIPVSYASGQGSQNAPSTSSILFGGYANNNSNTSANHNVWEFTGAGAAVVETVTSS